MMFQHKDFSAVLQIITNPTPESFNSFLNIFCRNLHFDGAVIYLNVGNPEKLMFFAGVYKGNPVREIPQKFPYLTPQNIGSNIFQGTQNKFFEFERENLPEEVNQFLAKFNINKVFLMPILTSTQNYGILVAGTESRRQLTPEETESLKSHTVMFSILINIYHTKWVYDVVRNNIREHVILQDLDHRILEANRAAALSIGIENPDELKGKFCYELWHQRNTPCPFCPLELTRKTLKPEEKEVMTPDGRWFLIRSNPILNEAGELVGFVELTLETTERKKAEQEARRFQEIVKHLFEQPLVGVTISDYDGKILEANETRAKMLGYTREELLKMNWRDYTHPDDVPAILEKVKELKEKKIENFIMDVRCTSKDGKIVWQRLFVMPLEFEKENLLISMIMDISEDVTLKEELQKLLKERTAILEAIPQRIYKVTKEGNVLPVTKTSEEAEKLSDIIRRTDKDAKELIKTVLESEEPHKILYNRKTEREDRYFSSTLTKLDEETTILVENDITEIKRQEIEALKQRNRFRRLTEGIIKTLSHIIELKEPYTAGHQSRVAEIAYLVGKEMGLDEDRLTTLRYAGLLHDIGKLIIPIEILNKPSKLTESEFNLIKQHPSFSYEILKDIEFEGPVAEIVLQHHERLDGSGYPKGLKNGEILLEARIIACADVYEAMTSHRPYRPALSPKEALRELKEKAGILYDPEVVRIMEKLYLEGKLPKATSEK